MQKKVYLPEMPNGFVYSLEVKMCINGGRSPEDRKSESRGVRKAKASRSKNEKGKSKNPLPIAFVLPGFRVDKVEPSFLLFNFYFLIIILIIPLPKGWRMVAVAGRCSG